MASVELKYVCRHDRTLKMANTGTCGLKKARAKARPTDITLDRCRECRGPLELDSPEARHAVPPPLPPKQPAPAAEPTPMCKYHPERPAKLRKDGHSTGCCEECLAERTAKARAVKEAGTGRAAPDGPTEPRCKNHPDRPAKVRKDGRSSGLCPECLKAITAKAQAARWEKSRAVKAKVAAMRAGAGQEESEAALREFDAKYVRARKEIEPESKPAASARTACATPVSRPALKAPAMSPAEARRFTKKRAEEMLGNLFCRELGDLTTALQGKDDCVIRTKAETVCRIAETLGEAGILPGWVAA